MHHDGQDQQVSALAVLPSFRILTLCRGDKVHIEANYEFSKFPGLKATEIMGIAIMYAAMDI